MSTTTPNRSLNKLEDADNVEVALTTLLGENADILDTHTHTAAEVSSGSFAPGRLGTGSPTGTTVLTGDGNWTDTTSMLALQQESAVTITGGVISGITDLAVADGGTGASTAGNARTNLGLGNVQNVDQTVASNITSGLLAAARLGSGSSGAGLKFLLDNQTFGDIGGWTSYTPSLTGSTSNPTLGTSSHNLGAYKQIGKMVDVYVALRFGTSGTINGGSGIYYFDLPVNADLTANTAGLSSEQLGFGLLFRGSAGDTAFGGGPGAHLPITVHTHSPNANQCLMVASPGALYTWAVRQGTNADAVVANTAKDITATGGPGNLCALAVGIPQTNANYRLIGTFPWFSSAANTTMWAQIKEGSTILAQSPSYVAAAGNAIGGGTANQNTARVEYFLTTPTLGTHTYKLTAFADQNCTIAYDNTNLQYPKLEVQQVPYDSAPQYVSNTWPWTWQDAVEQPEIWMRLRYQAA